MNMITVDGDYGRVREAYISHGTCDVCEKENVPTFMMDGSDGEYSCLAVCLPCIIGWFKEYEDSDESKR